MDWKHGIDTLLQYRSAQEIANEVGLSVSSIYDLRNGYTKEPRGMAAVRLYKLIAKFGAGEVVDHQQKEGA